MNVILLESIQNLGTLGDTVKVKPGYARNYLVPHGKAVAATPANLEEFEARRSDLEQRQADAFAAAQAKAAALEGVSVTIARKAGDEGKLFGSVVANDIATALQEAGVEVEKQAVRLGDGPLRQAGEHAVGIRLHADVDASITVHVVPET